MACELDEVAAPQEEPWRFHLERLLITNSNASGGSTFIRQALKASLPAAPDNLRSDIEQLLHAFKTNTPGLTRAGAFELLHPNRPVPARWRRPCLSANLSGTCARSSKAPRKKYKSAEASITVHNGINRPCLVQASSRVGRAEHDPASYSSCGASCSQPAGRNRHAAVATGRMDSASSPVSSTDGNFVIVEVLEPLVCSDKGTTSAMTSSSSAPPCAILAAAEAAMCTLLDSTAYFELLPELSIYQVVGGPHPILFDALEDAIRMGPFTDASQRLQSVGAEAQLLAGSFPASARVVLEDGRFFLRLRSRLGWVATMLSFREELVVQSTTAPASG